MQSPLRPQFRSIKSVVGMVHLLPLPGAPRFAGSMPDILARARLDAESLVAGGVHGIIVENYGDAPFYPETLPPATVAALALAVAEVRRASDLPVGVNALRNDAAAAISIAACTGAQFIRINVHSGAMLTDQGWITGRAYETMRMRAALNAPVAVFADVFVKHATAPAGLAIEDAARDAFERGGADALIVSGSATGVATDIQDARRVRQVLPDAPLWIGSGVTTQNVAALLDIADGVIVGTAFEQGGRAGAPVIVEQVRALVDVVRGKFS